MHHTQYCTCVRLCWATCVMVLKWFPESENTEAEVVTEEECNACRTAIFTLSCSLSAVFHHLGAYQWLSDDDFVSCRAVWMCIDLCDRKKCLCVCVYLWVVYHYWWLFQLHTFTRVFEPRPPQWCPTSLLQPNKEGMEKNRSHQQAAKTPFCSGT